MECAVTGGSAKVEFVDGVADAVAYVAVRIAGAVGVASIGRLGHPNANETYGHRRCGEANRFGASFAGNDTSLQESLPDTMRRRFDGIVPRPILDGIARRERLAPSDANAVDGLRLRHIEDDPLR